MGRRKGNSAFPVARIKKMMQADEDVGKIATVTPVLVAKALECMMEHVLTEAADVARRRQTKTVTPQHLKYCVANNDHFDFLRPTLAHIANLEEHPHLSGHSTLPPRKTRPKRPRSPIAPHPNRSASVPSVPDHQSVPLLAPAPTAPTSPHPTSMPLTHPPAPSLDVDAHAPGKRHKLRSPLTAAPSISPLSHLASAAGSSADLPVDEDEDNYDDEDDDDATAPSTLQSAPVVIPSLSVSTVQPPVLPEKDDSKASERVSVQALLS